MSFESVNVMNKQELGCNPSKTVEHGHDALDSRMSCSDREDGEVEDGEIDDDDDGGVENNDSTSTLDKSPTKPSKPQEDVNSDDDHGHNGKRHKDKKRRHKKEKRHHHVSHKRRRGTPVEQDGPDRRDHSPSVKKFRRSEGENRRPWDYDRQSPTDEDSGVFGVSSHGSGGMTNNNSSRTSNSHSSNSRRRSHEHEDNEKRSSRIRRHRSNGSRDNDKEKESVESGPSDERDSDHDERMQDLFSDGDDLDLDVAVHERDGAFQRPARKDHRPDRQRGRKKSSMKKSLQSNEYWNNRHRREENYPRRREQERERKRCRFYMEGRCGKDGEEADHCPFSHDFNPPKKLELCKFYAISSCLKGEYCVYMHDDFPCKFYHTGARVCKYEDDCKFSHDQLTRDTKKVLERFMEERDNNSADDKGNDDNSNIIDPFNLGEEEAAEEPPEMADGKNSLLGSPPHVPQNRGRERGFGPESSPCDPMRGSSPSMQRNQGPSPPPFAAQNTRPQSAQSPQNCGSNPPNMNQHHSGKSNVGTISILENKYFGGGNSNDNLDLNYIYPPTLMSQNIRPLMSISTERPKFGTEKVGRKKRRRRRRAQQNQLLNNRKPPSGIPLTMINSFIQTQPLPTSVSQTLTNTVAGASEQQLKVNPASIRPFVPPIRFTIQKPSKPALRIASTVPQVSPVSSEALAAAVALARSIAAKNKVKASTAIAKLPCDTKIVELLPSTSQMTKPFGMNSSPGEQMGGPMNNPHGPPPHMSGPMPRRPMGLNQGGPMPPNMGGPPMGPGGHMMMQNRPPGFPGNPRMGPGPMMGRPPANMLPPRGMMMRYGGGMGIRPPTRPEMGGYVDPQLDDLASMLVQEKKQQGDGPRDDESMLKAAGADDSDFDEEGDSLDAMVHRMRKESEEHQRRQEQPPNNQGPPMQGQRLPFQQYPPPMNQVPPLMNPQQRPMMGGPDFGMRMGIRSGYTPQQMFNPPPPSQGMFMGPRPPVNPQSMNFSPSSNDGAMENGAVGAKELYLRIAKQTATGRQEQLARENERQSKSPAAETPASPPMCDPEPNLGPREWKLIPLDVPLKTPYPLMRLPHDLHYSRSDPRLTGQLRLGGPGSAQPSSKPSTPTHEHPSDPQPGVVKVPSDASSPSSTEMGGRAYTPSMSNVNIGNPVTKDPRLGRQISSPNIASGFTPEMPAALLQKPINDSLPDFKLEIDVEPQLPPPPKMQLSDRASNFQSSEDNKLKLNTSAGSIPSLQSPQAETRAYLMDPRFRRRKASVPSGSTGSAPDSDTSIDGSLSTPEKLTLDSALKKDTTPVPSSGETSPV